MDTRSRAKEQIAGSLAKASALEYGTELKQEEIIHLIDELFACSTPNFSPDGKRVLHIIPVTDIEKSFLKWQIVVILRKLNNGLALVTGHKQVI